MSSTPPRWRTSSARASSTSWTPPSSRARRRCGACSGCSRTGSYLGDLMPQLTREGGVRVFIGSENAHIEMHDVSLVLAPYGRAGRAVGWWASLAPPAWRTPRDLDRPLCERPHERAGGPPVRMNDPSPTNEPATSDTGAVDGEQPRTAPRPAPRSASTRLTRPVRPILIDGSRSRSQSSRRAPRRGSRDGRASAGSGSEPRPTSRTTSAAPRRSGSGSWARQRGAAAQGAGRSRTTLPVPSSMCPRNSRARPGWRASPPSSARCSALLESRGRDRPSRRSGTHLRPAPARGCDHAAHRRGSRGDRDPGAPARLPDPGPRTAAGAGRGGHGAMSGRRVADHRRI